MGPAFPYVNDRKHLVVTTQTIGPQKPGQAAQATQRRMQTIAKSNAGPELLQNVTYLRLVLIEQTLVKRATVPKSGKRQEDLEKPCHLPRNVNMLPPHTLKHFYLTICRRSLHGLWRLLHLTYETIVWSEKGRIHKRIQDWHWWHIPYNQPKE